MEFSMDQIRLLLVDDEEDFLDLFVKRFSKKGFSVHGVNRGLEALKYLEGNKVDVIILDVKMPGMDGIETLKEIKKRYSVVEVIMLTGHGSIESGIQGMSYGAYDYVMKPFDTDDLIKKINEAYDRKCINEQKNTD